MTRLSGESDAYFAGLLAAIEQCGIEIREEIDYRTAAELPLVEWLDALGTLIEIADDLREWATAQIHAVTEPR